MNTADLTTTVIVIVLLAASLAIALSQIYVTTRDRRARSRRIPVSDTCRAARESRVRLIDNMDPVTIAYMCEYRHATELAGLQHWIDRLAQNDRKGAGR